MAAETSKERFADAVTLLNYGFGKCQIYTDEASEGIEPVKVENGVKEEAAVERSGPFTYLDTTGANLNGIEKTIELNEKISAPIRAGDVVGAVVYTLDGSEIGRTELIAAEDIKKAKMIDYLLKTLKEACL